MVAVVGSYSKHVCGLARTNMTVPAQQCCEEIGKGEKNLIREI